jgi:6-hydroxycyclohex-1-ene-1-carbonyl-CoA dehydrogenase
MNATKMPAVIETWQMVSPSDRDKNGMIELTKLPMPDLRDGDVVVEIAGCGVCGSDLGYYYEGIRTVNKAPITLGHEISGRVIAGETAWIGKEVIIPTILPCGECELCHSGRSNRCLRQKMPGNSLGIYGGFSSHIVVPSSFLCEVPQRGLIPLEKLAVVADAISTPYQAARRADLHHGDKVIIIGVTGGCGFYLAQWCKVFGVQTVVGIGRDDVKLDRALQYGCDAVLNCRTATTWELKKGLSKLCRDREIEANWGWKIFEITGTKPGQELALDLLGYTGMLVVVGYSPEDISYNLSRFSAFDAELRGSWGTCAEYYPIILNEVLAGKIQFQDFVELRNMSEIKEVFAEHHKNGSPLRRVVLTPDFQ